MQPGEQQASDEPEPKSEELSINSDFSSSDPEVGKRWEGRFDILARLGEGSTGKVFKARHVLLDQLVAVKIYKSDQPDSVISSKRFQNEASVLSSIDHPNILKFHSYGRSAAGRHYMVLEYLEGKTLAQILAEEGPLTQKRAVPLFKEVCTALAYIHQIGIIHRDLKPANLMILKGENGESIKLLDFGIFKSLSGVNQGLTQTGALIGTPNYMSPELCKLQAVDQRSDIYSLGCLFYETLSGTPPMQGQSTLLVMSEHANKLILSVPAKHLISTTLEQLILKCLAKDPENRYQSAAQLLNELEKCNDSPVNNKKSKSRRGSLVAIALCILPILAALLWNRYTEFPRPPAAIVKPNRIKSIGDLIPTKEDDDATALPKIDAWIVKHLNDSPQNVIELSKAVIRANELRAAYEHKGATPCAVKVEELLQKQLQNTDLASSNQMRLALARIQISNKHFDEAANSLYKVLQQVQKDDNESRTEATIYCELSRISQERNDYTSAIEFEHKRENILKRLAVYDDLCDTYIQELGMLKSQGKQAELKQRLILATAAYKDLLSQGRFAAGKAAALAKALIENKDYRLLLELSEKFGNNAVPQGTYKPPIVELNMSLASAYTETKQYRKASELLNKLSKYLRSSARDQNVRDTVAKMQAEVLYKSGQKDEIPKQIQSYLAMIKEDSPNRYSESLKEAISTLKSFKLNADSLEQENEKLKLLN